MSEFNGYAEAEQRWFETEGSLAQNAQEIYDVVKILLDTGFTSHAIVPNTTTADLQEWLFPTELDKSDKKGAAGSLNKTGKGLLVSLSCGDDIDTGGHEVCMDVIGQTQNGDRIELLYILLFDESGRFTDQSAVQYEFSNKYRISSADPGKPLVENMQGTTSEYTRWGSLALELAPLALQTREKGPVTQTDLDTVQALMTEMTKACQ